MTNRRSLCSQSRVTASCALCFVSGSLLRRSFKTRLYAVELAKKRSQKILVAALLISMLEQVARVASDEVLIASSLPFGEGIVGWGGELCTSVSWTTCRSPWATPLAATNAKTPGRVMLVFKLPVPGTICTHPGRARAGDRLSWAPCFGTCHGGRCIEPRSCITQRGQ